LLRQGVHQHTQALIPGQGAIAVKALPHEKLLLKKSPPTGSAVKNKKGVKVTFSRIPWKGQRKKQYNDWKVKPLLKWGPAHKGRPIKN